MPACPSSRSGSSDPPAVWRVVYSLSPRCIAPASPSVVSVMPVYTPHSFAQNFKHSTWYDRLRAFRGSRIGERLVMNHNSGEEQNLALWWVKLWSSLWGTVIVIENTPLSHVMSTSKYPRTQREMVRGSPLSMQGAKRQIPHNQGQASLSSDVAPDARKIVRLREPC